MSVNSMTGFGSAEQTRGASTITVEIKTLNSRFLEISCSLPQRFAGSEIEIRNILQTYFARGRISVTAKIQGTEPSSGRDSFIHRFSRVRDALQEMELIPKEEESRRAALLQVALTVLGSGVSLPAEKAEETTQDIALEKLIVEITKSAAIAAHESRSREGEKLEKIIVSVASEIDKLIALSASLVPGCRKLFEKRLRDKLGAVSEEVSADDPRFALEIVLQLERFDCKEELDRLQVHGQELRNVLSGKDVKGIGKKLDFLAQEMARESSTLATKSQGTEISAISRELRSLVEQLREQVQNIE